MQNKTANYIKYAIGEIVLVVIGILIALQINNWNEIRKTNLEEQRALLNIQSDFSKNKELLKVLIATTESAIDAGIKILNYTGSKEKPKNEDKFNDLLNVLFSHDPYYPQNGFLDDLLNSGKLGIFENVELRNLLSSWKPNLEILNEKFTGGVEGERILNNFIIENGSWLNADQITKVKRNVVFPKSGFDIDNRIFLEVSKFENLVENHVIGSDNYLSEQKKTTELLDNILELINKEIKEE
jgi:hypothetical protein